MADRSLRRIFILAAVAALLWIMYLLKPVVIPFLAAFLIAYLLSPLVHYLHRVGLARWLAISIVYLGLGVLMTIAVWYVIPLLWKQLMIGRETLPVAVEWVNQTLLPWVAKTFNTDLLEFDATQISTVIMDYIQTNYNVNSIQSMLLSVAHSGLNVIQIGGMVVLIPIISFYFLLDWERMLDNMRRLIPRNYERSTLTIVSECHSVLGAFVKGQFLVMFLLGAVYALGLQLIGVEVGLIIGMVAGICSIIPYLGFAVGIIAAVIATLLQFGMDWWQLILVGVVFMVGQAIEGYVLQPFLLGDKIGLSPVAVVFAVLAGAQLAGLLGMLIALPVAAVIVVLLKHVLDNYQHSHWYGNNNPVIITPAEELVLPEQSVQSHANSSTIAQQATEKSSNIDTIQHSDINKGD